MNSKLETIYEIKCANLQFKRISFYRGTVIEEEICPEWVKAESKTYAEAVELWKKKTNEEITNTTNALGGYAGIAHKYRREQMQKYIDYQRQQLANYDAGRITDQEIFEDTNIPVLKTVRVKQ